MRGPLADARPLSRPPPARLEHSRISSFPHFRHTQALSCRPFPEAVRRMGRDDGRCSCRDMGASLSAHPAGPLRIRDPMRAEILTIGDELLSGITVNTNASFIAARLTELGIRVTRVLTLPDSEEEISEALHKAFHDSDLTVENGGESR